MRYLHNAFERIPGLGCDKSVTLLYTLSFHGCHELVKVILFEEQADVNAQGGPYGNALQAASAKGKEEVVRMLLEKEADVNAQGGLYGNAAKSKTKSDLSRNSAVYHPPSTYHHTGKFIIVTTFAVFFILWGMKAWMGIKHVSG